MTRIRRTLAVLVSMAAMVFSTSLQAAAAFQDSAAVQTTVTTGSVTAPSSVAVNGCRFWVPSGSYWNGWRWVTTYTEMYRATVSWSAGSAPRGVSGYRVIAYSGATNVLQQDVAVSPRQIVQEMPSSYVPTGVTAAVTTLTSYGWTAESARTAVPTPGEVPAC